MTACGCVAAPVVAPVVSSEQLAQRLSAALAAQDSSAFASAFADAAAAKSQAARWFAVLSSGQGQVVADGSDQLQVLTTLPGDRRSATEQLTVQWASAGAGGFTVIAGSGTPLWVLEPATATSGEAGTVVTADGADAAQSWLNRAASAVAAVRSSGVVADGWSGRLVLELPRSADDFALLSGSTADTSSAVTSCRTGTPRIVISPVLQQYSADVQSATLIHEAVHAATDSPCQQGLSWAVEGLAESVAAQAVPTTAKTNRALVEDYLAEHPVPSTLPEHPSTPTDYALAQVAADQLRLRLGDRAPDFFARATRGALTAAEVVQATAWYREALRVLAG